KTRPFMRVLDRLRAPLHHFLAPYMMAFLGILALDLGISVKRFKEAGTSSRTMQDYMAIGVNEGGAHFSETDLRMSKGMQIGMFINAAMLAGFILVPTTIGKFRARSENVKFLRAAKHLETLGFTPETYTLDPSK